ncbi:hypothetical protein [Actinophytocola sp.]|uniref:hypothetical protein n=1 Tax=Actinophytocola sp. TaxID=1872138 RepID=UPI002D800032|nr:hypothetical protein [Actinophytocola sp.]HET9138521.1 hypothetical protein [Actinophytocola sp.]
MAMLIRPQWTHYRTVGVTVAALVLVSFLVSQHTLCPTSHHTEHRHTESVSEASADEHGCGTHHQRGSDVRADRTYAVSRGVAGLVVLPTAKPGAWAAVAATIGRTESPQHGRHRWRPGRILLADLCVARS